MNPSSSMQKVQREEGKPDLGAVVKMVQSISAEIVPRNLIDKLLTTAIKHSGASRGVFLLFQNDELRIEAEGTVNEENISVSRQVGSTALTNLPESIIREMVRRRESFILADPLLSETFSSDDYLKRERPRSVLCLPLLKEAQFIGAIYLENKVTANVFTSDTLDVLNYLAIQGVISLENADLYAALSQKDRYQKVAEAEFQKQIANIDELFDLAPVAMALVTMKAEVLRINREFTALFGFDSSEIVGRNAYEMIVPEDKQGDYQYMKLTWANGYKVDFETIRKKKNGDRFNVSVVGGRIGEDRGYTIYRDISARVKAEEAVKSSQARLEEAQRISRTGSWEYNIGTKSLVWSDEHYRIFGINPDGTPITFDTFLSRIQPADRAFVEETFAEAWRTGKGFSYHYQTVLLDGEKKHLQGEGRPVADGMGGFKGFIGTTMDITERKRSEEELRKVQSELAHVTRVTTLGELAASIAHEVSQPIAAMVINANASLRWLNMIEGDSEPILETREAVQRIIRDGHQAGEIVARIRGMFKKAQPTMEPLDINETIREVIVITRNEMDKRKVRLEWKLASNLPRVLGDRVQLQQVVLNLILNAMEAMSTSEGTRAELSVQTQLNDKREVIVGIRDNGPGLESNCLEKIFEAFHTTKAGGLGMGLSISRTIVESHSGKLWVTMNEGPGLTFHFSLATHCE
jgi:PAS domain S-box-containing protein